MSGVRNSSVDIMRRIRSSEGESGFNRRSPGQSHWWKLPRRYQVAVMCYLAFAIKGCMDTNFLATFVHFLTMNQGERKEHYPKTLNWTIEDLESHLDLNYWGSVAIQLPAAMLTLSFSPNKIMLISILLTSCLHMIWPLIAYGTNIWMWIITFFQGFAAGSLSAACMGVWREWAPADERTSLLVLTFSGQMMNFYVALPLSMYLAEETGPFSMFYFAGIAGLMWCLFWNILIFESPSCDPLITIQELCYLEEKIPPESKEKVSLRSVPIKSMLTSLPMQCLFLVFFMTSFLRKVMFLSGILINTEIMQLGYDLTITHWIQIVSLVLILPATGFLVDYLIRRLSISALHMRRIFCSGGLILYAIFMFFTFLPLGLETLIFHTFSFICLTLCLIGYMPNVLEISPRYASVTIAVCILFSRLSALLFDTIVEAYQEENKSILHSRWQEAMIPCGVIAIISGIMYGIFASSDEQSWSSPALPFHPMPKDSKCYPTAEIEDDTLVSDNL